MVILNKTDLVTEEQQLDILDRISILNPKVKVLKSCQSKIDVMEILNTNLYSRNRVTLFSHRYFWSENHYCDCYCGLFLLLSKVVH